VSISSIVHGEGGRRVDFEVRIAQRVYRFYFSSSHSLTLSADALLAMFLLPAMRSGSALELPQAPDEVLAESLPTLQAIYNVWRSQYQKVPVNWPPSHHHAAAAAQGTGSFFSGGVDSFFTLLTHRQTISHLIFVHGYDIPLEHAALRERASRMVRQVAQALGKHAIEVETNFRVLLNDFAPWGMSHGGALASIAHLHAGHIGQVFIPSTHTFAELFPWGSHPLLDPLWSSSGLKFVHHGCEFSRSRKVAVVAQSDLALQHLRVCWQNPNQEYNCCRCEKCLRTMISLHALGRLKDCATFTAPIDPKAVSKLIASDDNTRAFMEDNLRALEASTAPFDRVICRSLKKALANPRWQIRLLKWSMDTGRRAKRYVYRRMAGVLSRLTTLTQIILVVLLTGCASGGHPTPDAIFRHPTTGDVQWCDKGSVAATVVLGPMMGAAQGADYGGCKTNWETKGYVRLDSTAKLSPPDQQRYEAELERMAKERADSIRPR
jgi:hypothetical protein